MRLVVLLARANIPKCREKSGTFSDFEQEFRNPDAREQGIEFAVKSFRFRWSCRMQRNDFQLFANECHARQAAGPQLVCEVAQSPIKLGALISQIFSGIHVDRQVGDC